MRGFARLRPHTATTSTNHESIARNGPTCGIGIGTIVILLALEKVGQTWGKKNFAVKYVATSRAVVVMVVFTLISYLVNRNRGQDLVWAISKVNTHGIAPPKAHDAALLSKVAARAFAPLAASTLEHLAVAKAFGRRNGYAIDQTQVSILPARFRPYTVGGTKWH